MLCLDFLSQIHLPFQNLPDYKFYPLFSLLISFRICILICCHFF